jgi:dolichol-phosphate mannosyltransferase
VVPTYNEKENLDELVRRVQQACSSAGLSAELVIVDDNSPDGTGARAEEIAKSENLKVVHRSGKLGLSSAVLEGFKAASGSILVVMDADLSHPPEKIPEMVSKIESGEADVVVGSRYVRGGSVENWPFTRRIISKGATLLARWLTKVKDPMSGFFALKRSVIDGVPLDPVGYKIGLEILVKGKYAKVAEVPIHFADRKAGKSKLGGGEYLRYIDHVIMLYEYRKPWLSRYIKFSAIGGLGAVINTAVLWTANEIFFVYYLWASVLAFSVAVTSNYFMNRKWTYRSKGSMPKQYSQFLAVSAFGLVLNLIILKGIVDVAMPALDFGKDKASLYLVVANLITIFIVSIFNFFVNSLWTFRHETRRK